MPYESNMLKHHVSGGGRPNRAGGPPLVRASDPPLFSCLS